MAINIQQYEGASILGSSPAWRDHELRVAVLLLLFHCFCWIAQAARLRAVLLLKLLELLLP
jgi:hypothetical protein